MAALMAEMRRDYMAEFVNVLAQFDALVSDSDAAALAGLGHQSRRSRPESTRATMVALK